MRYAGADSGGMDSGGDGGGHTPAKCNEARDASASAPQRDALPDGSYAVSHLIAERNLGTLRQFRVRWIGYSSADDTWENARDILTPVLIEHFERLRDSCAGDVRTALRLQLDSLGARREQHGQLLGVDGAAWLHKAGPHASFESAEDDSDVETAMRWWLSAQWSDEGAQQQPAQKCPKRPDSSNDFWVACDRCHKWRNLYLRGSSRQVGDKWYCEQNPDPLHDDCSYAQEEDEDEVEEADASSLNGFKQASDHAAGGSLPTSSTSNAVGKRPRESDLEPPPWCMPPPVDASKYAEGHCVRSADGSMWKVEASRSRSWSWSFRWVYAQVEQRPVLEARLRTERVPLERTPCRHCGKLCFGKGLIQHEATCAARPGADGPAPTSNAAMSTGAPIPLLPIPPDPTSTAATALAAAPRASSTEHAQLVERLEKHMAAHRLSQLQMAKALKVPSCDIVSRWLGCSRDPLPAATEAETDARITAYLDAYIPPAPIFAASAASTASPALAASPAVPLVSTEHAQLVERLEEHMVAHRLSQTLVAKALKFASAGKLSLWLGRCRQQTLGAATILEVDARIAAYLDGWEMPQAQAAPPLKRLLEATLPAAAPKQKNWRNKGVGETKWARRKRLKQKTPMLTAVRGGNRYTVDQSGGCSPGANPSPSPNPSPNPNPNQRRRRRRARTTPSPRPSYFRSPRTGRRLASLRLLRRSATAALRVCGSAAAGSAHATRVAAALRARRGAA